MPPSLFHLLLNLFIQPHQHFLPLIISLPLWILLIHQIHFVYQTPHPSIWRVLSQGEEDFLEICNIRIPIGSGVIEYVDEDSDVGEDGIFLGREVVVYKGGLAATVPQVLKRSGISPLLCLPFVSPQSIR